MCPMERNLSARGGGEGIGPRVPNTGLPVSWGGKRVAVASSLLISAGLILFPTQRQCLSPFDNLQLLLFFTDILCFSLSLSNEWRG